MRSRQLQLAAVGRPAGMILRSSQSRQLLYHRSPGPGRPGYLILWAALASFSPSPAFVIMAFDLGQKGTAMSSRCRCNVRDASQSGRAGKFPVKRHYAA